MYNMVRHVALSVCKPPLNVCLVGHIILHSVDQVPNKEGIRDEHYESLPLLAKVGNAMFILH